MDHNTSCMLLEEFYKMQSLLLNVFSMHGTVVGIITKYIRQNSDISIDVREMTLHYCKA